MILSLKVMALFYDLSCKKNMWRDNIIHIKALWDHDAEMWVAESDDVPGLVTEAETTEQLIRKLEIMIPELLEANGLLAEYAHPDIPIHLLSERTEMVKCRA